MHHDAQRPPVNGASVAFVGRKDLRRHVLRCSHQGVRAECLLAAPEVHQFGVSAHVQEHVFGLEIAIHDAARVQVLQGKDHGTAVELRLLPGEATDFTDDVKELAPAKELGQEIHMIGILERLDELHYARVIALSIDLPLDADRALLPLLQYRSLLHALQCVSTQLVVLVVDQLHSTNVSLPNYSLEAQVCHGDVQILEVHAMLELVPEAANDVAEGRLRNAEAHAGLLRHACCRTPLVAHEASLSKVIPTCKPAQLLPVFHNAHNATLDEVEIRGLGALPHDGLTFSVAPPL
mmetsp:Transcript_82579/g.229113  ORF Transcript_82579/g.229113 Transcript_82579/m.229113 type:complete len:293 (+) Transcript_82579:495-1373(+)